ncbi:MAG: PKD domain-containing protein [Candidatus Brockarchaeota archaeon]|nr:PKD domain-containing protein [Candidatus Brockarchaeota archaeon]
MEVKSSLILLMGIILMAAGFYIYVSSETHGVSKAEPAVEPLPTSTPSTAEEPTVLTVELTEWQALPGRWVSLTGCVRGASEAEIYWGDGSRIDALRDIWIHQYAKPGRYKVELTASNGTHRVEKTVEVEALPDDALTPVTSTLMTVFKPLALLNGLGAVSLRDVAVGVLALGLLSTCLSLVFRRGVSS